MGEAGADFPSGGAAVKQDRDHRHEFPFLTEDLSTATTRREFLARMGLGAALLAGGALLPFNPAAALGQDTPPVTPTLPPAPTPGAAAASPTPAGVYDLAVIKGEAPAAICRQAVEALGGMKRFVKPGNVVVVKPNIGWDRTPELAANTNPEVVAELVKMALEAGAKTVKVFDNTCNNARSCYMRSGIQAAAEAAGAQVYHFDERRCKTVPVPNGEFLKEWPVFVDAIEADVFINCPIAKTHGLSGVTLGMKNLMGVIGGNRGHWHRQIHNSLPEFLGVLKPHLTVIDAWRIMHRGGPTGGSPEDVTLKQMVIASADPVAADARACALFGRKPEEMEFIRNAFARGFGQMDLSKLQVLERV